ncbi:Beta-fructofuranosidase, soluble isoenzyme I like [Actinidia chinensis var. chinensis]|uniref:beta-fructofuranosidase n=2 Tax=Actinidia chinensis TaxID=3625 RepID=A0A2R6PLY4_ACTCC|nr:vacuolar invertase [Actinidia chinensis]PSR93342.1 Beta-fructofuranosidase, soluble isoenzyme I like [Actinidia chinensis var. chinensis]
MDTNLSSYTRLPDQPTAAPNRRPVKAIAGIFLSILLLSSLVAFILNNGPRDAPNNVPKSQVLPETWMPPSRGVEQGVSEKAFREYSGMDPEYNWTNTMLAWQRTAFHFQPQKNWMNDPNAPLFHMGWYHIWYQYNPDSAIWGNITWGHAVSTDLIHWLHLPIAMVPDHWFDSNGVWTGSATLLPDGQIVILYTGDTDDYVQVQNLAYPANLSDPLLLDLVKYEGNPIMVPPPGIGMKDFRDPTTAWVGPDGKWRVAIGSKVNTTGITLVYQTTNFTSYELLEGVMHAVPGTGMWECVDFYPVSTTGRNGLDTSVNGPGIKHVLKASLDDEKKDFYALGTYDTINDKWTPDDPELDVGVGLRVDYGKYYASKTFYDHNKQRRILWGWIGETDSEYDDLMKGWASVQTIPRTVVFDVKTGTNILQWPVEEVEELRRNSIEFNGVELAPGSIVPLNIRSATQLDITATFEVDKEALEGVLEVDVGYNCSTAGAGVRGALGPFGLIVLADHSLFELTPVYFYISKDVGGGYKTFFCADEIRSSLALEVNKKVHGGMVPVLDGEKLTMRLLVDHSIVESFAQGGRTVITSRIYPTKAVDGAARAFLFNNATGVSVTASLTVWEMKSAYIKPYPFDDI